MFSQQHTQVSNGGYQISRSLRFNSADSAYLNRTPASAGNKQIWTLSVWVKRGSLSAFNPIFSAGPVSPRASILFQSDNKLQVRQVDSTDTEVIKLVTTQVFRDPSAWYHIVVAQDTTQATSSNRVKIYVNGTQITAFDTATYPSQNISNLAINDALEHNYGRYVNSPSDGYLSAYLTETNFIDGSQLTPSSFGETNAQTGVWTPKAYAGSYGTNGFYLNFSDNSNTTAATLGKDYSGNGNNWTPNNFSVTAGTGNDSLVDSPTSYGTDTGAGGTVRGNYCTWSAVDRNPIFTLTNGNLDCAQSAAEGSLRATIAVSSGKWYWEITVGTGNNVVGILLVDASLSSYLGGLAGSAGFNMSTGLTLVNTPFSSATGSSIGAFATNDIIGLALDFTDGTLKFYRNGTLITANHITNVSGLLAPAIGSNVATSGYIANFGQRPFAYTAPSGYKALCTQNLPTPTIGATSTTLATSFFAPVLYTGTGATQSVTVGFQPDFTWFKVRNQAYGHALFDSVRGAGNALQSNNTNAEAAWGSSTLTAFTSTGLTLGADTTYLVVNSSGNTFVAWNWKANGSGSTNTAGSITSTVSANTTSGFSVVTYTGNGTSPSTVGHGLGVAPSMMIFKARSVAGNSWDVYHSSLGATQYLLLNTTAAVSTSSWLNNTAPTSTVFTLSNFGDTNANGVTYVAYCFAEVAGYSKFGSYTGNGSSDGTFVYFGFRPAYVMIKASSAVDNWVIMDVARNPYNAVNYWLQAESSVAEATLTPPQFDFVSNGLKLRGTSSTCNASGVTYIYMAFASNPFKTSLAR